MTWRPMASVAGALVAVSLPVFLVGALSGRIGASLDTSEAGIGAAIGAFFAAAAVAALPGGQLVDRLGAQRSLRLGVSISVATLVALGTIVVTVEALIVALLVAGAALGLVDPGGARALTTILPPDRQGLGFGVKEASIPAASLVAGVVLPLVAGWRPAFVAAAVVGVVIAVLVRTGNDHRTARPPTPIAVTRAAAATPLVVAIAVASALGGGAAAVAATFMVPSAISGGWSQPAAATVLIVASSAAIATRLIVGRIVDRTAHGELWLVTIGLSIGAIGLVGLAAGSSTAAQGLLTRVLPVAAVLALGAGWSWTGLAFLAAVRISPDRPARAAGAVLAGLGAGGAAAPAGFGLLVTTTGYAAAWTGAALMMATAGAIAGGAARVRHGRWQPVR